MPGPISTGCQEHYAAVFSDTDETTWCVLGYQGNNIVPISKGTGGLQELIANFDDNEIMYGFLRMTKTDDCGDSVRTKFIFLTWVGPSSSPLKKGKVNGHKPDVSNLFKGFHIEKQLFERKELVGLDTELEVLLKKAGGANYDLGNTRSGIQKGNASEYKKATKEFFENKEKESKIGPVIYDKGPIKEGITHCDLGGRAMTVGQSQAKENIIDEWSLHKSGK